MTNIQKMNPTERVELIGRATVGISRLNPAAEILTHGKHQVLLSVFHDDSMNQIFMPPTNRTTVIEMYDPGSYAREDEMTSFPALLVLNLRCHSRLAPCGKYGWTSLLPHSFRSNRAATGQWACGDLRHGWCEYFISILWIREAIFEHRTDSCSQ